MLGPRWKKKEVIIDCTEMIEGMWFPVQRSHPSCGGLFERHYVDAGYSHTHTLWYGYIFLLFQGLNLFPPVLLLPLLFLPELPSLLSICSFSCLRRDPGYRCPEIQTVTTAEGVLNCWVCTLGAKGGGYQLAGCATFSVTDFWTPASVYEIPNPPPPSPV